MTQQLDIPIVDTCPFLRAQDAIDLAWIYFVVRGNPKCVDHAGRPVYCNGSTVDPIYLLIPVDLENRNHNGLRLTELIADDQKIQGQLRCIPLDLLLDLQRIHDDGPAEPEEFRKHMAKNLYELSGSYGLSLPHKEGP